MSGCFTKNNFTLNSIHLRQTLPYATCCTQIQRNFSDHFRRRDFDEMKKYDQDQQYPKEYIRRRDAWQVPLEKKQLRRAEKLEEKALLVPKEHEDEKFIVHFPGLPITLPTPQEEMFAIVNIKGRQYKVMQDDLIVTEIQKDVDVNDQVIFDSVYLVGTKDYTLIGRPQVKDAQIWCTVEQITKGLKTIVLKKIRRKGYRRSLGFRAKLITFRVDFIDYKLDQERHFDKAVSID